MDDAALMQALNLLDRVQIDTREARAALARLEAAAARAEALETAIRDALNELGVPDGNYPAPVSNAHDILTDALAGGDAETPR